MPKYPTRKSGCVSSTSSTKVTGKPVSVTRGSTSGSRRTNPTLTSLEDASSNPKIIAESHLPGEVQAAYVKAFNSLVHKRNEIHAKFDAAQTFTANENHWENADHFDPHATASLHVRRTLRSRSRYEVIENNPYLKGTLLTIANDFVGTGPKLQIIDPRISDDRAQVIEEKFSEWMTISKIRQKLWRMRMAKFTDGESFMIPYVNRNRRERYPVLLDFYVIETDRISSQSTAMPLPAANRGEIDGVRFDSYENPLEYFLLNRHPGGSSLDFLNFSDDLNAGRWIDAKNMIHWFRKDRGWLRGIPELTPSLPLCALLRRYTLSIVRHAEVLADFTILLETENPTSPNPLNMDANGNLVDDPFDIWPIEMGMMSNLPYGYKAHQMESVPLGTQYDAFVGALLREITRPILAPYNIAAGTSKDSNMASAVLDQHIYKGGQASERTHCDEEVLSILYWFWWNEAIRIPGYLGDSLLSGDRTFSTSGPKYRCRWDRVGIDHTDPEKAANALKVLHDKRFLTDADIQEGYYNRDVDIWRKEIQKDQKYRDTLEPVNPEDRPPPPATTNKPGAKKPVAKKKAKARNRQVANA